MRRQARGLTLLEMVLCAFVLATAIYGVLSIYPLGLAGMRQSQSLVVANNLARHYTEIWRATRYDVVAATLQPVPYKDVIDGVEYLTTVTVGDPSPPLSQVKEITVLVTWSAGSHNPRVNQLSCITCVYNVLNPW